MRQLVSLLFAAALLSACQTADGALSTPSTPTMFPGAAASAIAGDMASRLAEQIGPPGSTTLDMDKGTSEYATALEAALRGWGYTVVTDSKVEKGTKPVKLAYGIESMDGQVLARLSTPTIALGRAYTTTPGGATPSSPLSIMQRN